MRCSLNQENNQATFNLKFFSTRLRDGVTNPEDVLYEMFKNPETGQLSVGKFLAVNWFSVALRRKICLIEEISNKVFFFFP